MIEIFVIMAVLIQFVMGTVAQEKPENRKEYHVIKAKLKALWVLELTSLVFWLIHGEIVMSGMTGYMCVALFFMLMGICSARLICWNNSAKQMLSLVKVKDR